jgi:hypothetical protein
MLRSSITVWLFLLLFSQGFLSAQEVKNQTVAGIIRLDIYVRSDRESAKAVSEYAEDLGRRVPGLDVRVHDVVLHAEQLANLKEIAKKAGREKPILPAFHSCDRT